MNTEVFVYQKKVVKNIYEVSFTCREVELHLVNLKLLPNQINDVVVSLEEALSNIINYATPENGENDLDISLNISIVNRTIELCLRDNGLPFNLKSSPSPDLANYLNENKIGGFGILLIKNLMDFVESKRIRKFNVLTMRKKLILNN